MRSWRAIGAVALLVAVAGCGAVAPPDSGSTEGPVQSTASDVTETQSGTTTPGTATTTIPEAAIRDYGSLSDTSQSHAKFAIEQGSLTAARDRFTDDFGPGAEWSHLRYDGTVYDLSWSRGMVAEYRLARLPRVNASEVETTEDTIDYRNLTTEARELFTAVRSGDQTQWFTSERFPDQFRHNRFVAYQDNYYRIVYYTADVPVYTLTATPADAR
jgi:hypothetical protein